MSACAATSTPFASTLSNATAVSPASSEPSTSNESFRFSLSGPVDCRRMRTQE